MPTEKYWNQKMVRAPEALAMMPRIPSVDDEIDWRGFDVADLDTGCTRHSVYGPWQGDDSPIMQAARGQNLVEAGRLPFDPMDYKGFPGHGTRTQSVLCGALPGKLMGTAPGLPTVPYRVTNSVVITSLRTQKRMAAAIQHAVDTARCEVVSISLGTPLLSAFNNPLGEAVDHAYERGVIVVGAGGQVIDRVTYPGKFFRSIGVGGVLPDRTVYMEYAPADPDGNDTGDFIDVWAPADPIWRANSELIEGEVREAPYGTGDGTSYSAVQVAAAASMWLAFHGPQVIAEAYKKPWQRIEAFRKLLKATHSKVEGKYRPRNGTGILDIAALLQAKLPAAKDLKQEKRLSAEQWG